MSDHFQHGIFSRQCLSLIALGEKAFAICARMRDEDKMFAFVSKMISWQSTVWQYVCVCHCAIRRHFNRRKTERFKDNDRYGYRGINDCRNLQITMRHQIILQMNKKDCEGEIVLRQKRGCGPHSNMDYRYCVSADSGHQVPVENDHVSDGSISYSWFASDVRS